MNPLREQLMANTDEEYRQFTLPLLPGIPADTVLGVRTPVLRKLAKEYKHTDTAAAFLQDLPHKYYEEVNLHTFLLAYEKDFARYMEELEKILPEVKCWASCDGIRNPILKKGKPQPDKSLKDTENVPFKEDIEAYMQKNVYPYAPDAWVDAKASKIGYEIPFTREFYKYVAPRKSEDIFAHLQELEKEETALMAKIMGR